MPDSPLVSVIVPTKNSAEFLPACLQSIKDQTYPNIELIVVDNHSTDGTLKIAQTYTNNTFTKGPERSAQRNYGAEKSHGEYLLFIDSDMEVTSEVVKECVEKVAKNKAIRGIIIPEESFGEGFWAQCKALEKTFYVGNDDIEAARFFEKPAFIAVGGWSTSMVAGEDWYLTQQFRKSYQVARIASYIRHNEGKISISGTLKKKYYYASQFSNFVQASDSSIKILPQTNLLARYWVYIKRPAKLFTNPALGLGLLIMKTCEFGFGVTAYMIAKVGR